MTGHSLQPRTSKPSILSKEKWWLPRCLWPPLCRVPAKSRVWHIFWTQQSLWQAVLGIRAWTISYTSTYKRFTPLNHNAADRRLRPLAVTSGIDHLGFCMGVKPFKSNKCPGQNAGDRQLSNQDHSWPTSHLYTSASLSHLSTLLAWIVLAYFR